MYKQNHKTASGKSGQPFLWLKRKIVLILTAFMLGMANGMHTEDSKIKGNQNYTEQHKKD